MLIRNPVRCGPSQWTMAGVACATAMANSIALTRTLPGFRAAVIMPCGSTLVRIRRGLQA
jgi:hypothetical protein